MSKRLLFINPRPKTDVNLGTDVSFMNIPPMSFGYLAACTPSDWEIKVIDENLKRYNGEDADLVCFTSVTNNAPRVYELAFMFKEKGITTIMGGIHASMMPDEASRFVDTVVVGEGEKVWPKIISDFEKNRLKSYYKGEKASLDKLPIPRRDIYSKKYKNRGLIQTVQTARGCPMDCDFCSVTVFNGGLYRQRPVDDVLDELETLNSKFVFFIDDNILGYGKAAEKRAIDLFKGIIDRGLNIKWGSQASINFVNNDEVLKYASESGCFGMFCGFESLNEESLKGMHKVRNLKEGVSKFKEDIRKFQDSGIGVLGSFIFGNDSDKKDIFKKTSDFIFDSGLDGSQLSILTPFPGTKLYQRLKDENRLTHTDYPNDWVYYDVGHLLFKPKSMTSEELLHGTYDVYKETTSISSSFRRGLVSLMRTKNIYTSATSYLCNRGYGSLFIKKLEKQI
ncbi:MAG: B12-binding domain-containing radical SAM protein [Candidatus Aenigmarchaeota archaeon]|nr:B12-binding domain-containing radical SAM protein [Candidatus Aenigmarchaeota archaeon]